MLPSVWPASRPTAAPLPHNPTAQPDHHGDDDDEYHEQIIYFSVLCWLFLHFKFFSHLFLLFTSAFPLLPLTLMPVREEKNVALRWLKYTRYYRYQCVNICFFRASNSYINFFKVIRMCSCLSFSPGDSNSSIRTPTVGRYSPARELQ